MKKVDAATINALAWEIILIVLAFPLVDAPIVFLIRQSATIIVAMIIKHIMAFKK